MAQVKSLEELKKLREEALLKRELKKSSGEKQIIVGMGTSGIAAGARETMKAILDLIESENISGIVVTQTGGLGLDASEPIVQVVIGQEPKVTYGNVTPDIARRIVKEHVVNGNIVKSHVIPI
jgi:NADP-reducing hydrogenase subunit HndB